MFRFRGALLVQAIIVLVAALLRLPSLWQDGLWRDEGNVYVLATSANLSQMFSRMLVTQFHPPVYFIMAFAWTRIFGTSELAVKGLPYLASLVTILLVYRLARSAGGSDRVAAVAASIYAITPQAIVLATETLYPVAAMFCTLLTWLVFDAFRRSVTPVRAACIVAATALLMWTHYLALFFVPALVACTLVLGENRLRKIAIAAALIVGALPFIAWMPVFLTQQHTGLPYNVTHASLREHLSLFATLLRGWAPVSTRVFAWVAFALLFVALAVVAKHRQIRSLPFALGVLFVVWIGVVAANNLAQPRYIFPLYGLMCVFVASVFFDFLNAVRLQDPVAWRRAGVPVLAAMCALALSDNAAAAVRASQVPKSGIRSLVAHEPLSARTLYVLAPDYLASTFAFYSRNTHVTVRGFVRADHPEIFRIPRYAIDWNRPGVVDYQYNAISRQAVRYQYVTLILDSFAEDQGSVPYGKVWPLLTDLMRHYRLVHAAHYPGRLETVSEYVFRTSPA